jgi:hypothetical protein
MYHYIVLNISGCNGLKTKQHCGLNQVSVWSVQLFSVGGIDRCVFQWRTVGINAAEQEQDRYILKALEEAAFHKHQVCPSRHHSKHLHVKYSYVQLSHIASDICVHICS